MIRLCLVTGARPFQHILEHMIWYMPMVYLACTCTSKYSKLSLILIWGKAKSKRKQLSYEVTISKVFLVHLAILAENIYYCFLCDTCCRIFWWFFFFLSANYLTLISFNHTFEVVVKEIFPKPWARMTQLSKPFYYVWSQNVFKACCIACMTWMDASKLSCIFLSWANFVQVWHCWYSSWDLSNSSPGRSCNNKRSCGCHCESERHHRQNEIK